MYFTSLQPLPPYNSQFYLFLKVAVVGRLHVFHFSPTAISLHQPVLFVPKGGGRMHCILNTF